MSRRNLPPGVRRLCMTPWDGPVPLPGEYLATESGKRAYLVLSWRPRPKAEGYHVEVEVRPRADLARDGSTVHWFYWHKRERRRHD